MVKKQAAILLLLVFSSCFTYGQKRTLSYQAEIGGAVSKDRLPFWLYSNNYGKITSDSYLWGNVGLFSDFRKTNSRKFDFALGVEGTGSLGKDDNQLFIDQLFGRIRWQNLVLDVGVSHREILYDGLSASNGDMLFSTNSRSMPGISLSTWNYIKLPWIGKWVSFRAKYAEYLMTDDRFMGNRTRLHNKLLGIRLTPIPQFSIEAGMEHYAQWGGENADPSIGKQPTSFKDYLRVVAIRGGGEGALETDRINKMGNHIGQHFAKITYNGSQWSGELYYNHMFEDGSGQRFQNFPDGLYGIYLTRKNGSKWIKSLVYELYYTKSQSGPSHSRPATPEEIEGKDPNDPFPNEIVLGGNDDYFNNSVYRSGWTFHDRVIGTPFFTPNPLSANGLTLGVYNSRFVAHHIGLYGELPFEIKYKLLMSYSLNYGTHYAPFLDKQQNRISKNQFSLGLELITPDFGLPFNTSLHVGFDKGDLLKNNFGFMLKIFKTGIF